MRKIPAAGVTWRMGISPADANTYANVDKNTSRAKAHLVQLSSDYYIGVYPITQKQYALIGVKYRYFNNANLIPSGNYAGDMKPAPYGDWAYIRGGDWPTSSEITDNDTAIAKLRNLTGIEFELPTEAQWEFACRAGVGECLYSGKSWNEANLAEIAWNSVNSPSQFKDVGLLSPNAFGLYDMIGSVYEICLDLYSDNYVTGENGDLIVDPIGPESVSNGGTRSPRVARGGSIDDTLSWCASHIRTRLGATDSWAPIHYGFRVVAPMGGK
jgi:formylglycine-generating enzyme required for sulfatase activity